MNRIRLWKFTCGSLGILMMLIALAVDLDSEAPRTKKPLIFFMIGMILLFLRMAAAKIEGRRNDENT